MKVWKVRLLDCDKNGTLKKYGGVLILKTLSEWDDLFDGMENEEIGDEYAFEVIEMTEDELDSLPEFDGF